MMDARPIDLTRADLAEFIKSPRTVRAFENINVNNDILVQSVTEIQDAPVIGVELSPAFNHDRSLAGSSDIHLTDGGPKSSVGIELTTTGVSAATYGSATQMVGFAVDSKGRITLAAQYILNSNNVTEGSENLFFTTSRARAAVSGSPTITYDIATGIFQLTADNVTTALGYAPQTQSDYLDEIAETIPALDGTYTSPTSITIVNGIITAIS